MADSLELQVTCPNANGGHELLPKKPETEPLIERDNGANSNNRRRRKESSYERRLHESKERERKKLKHLDEHEQRKRERKNNENSEESTQRENEIKLDEMERKEFEQEMDRILADGDYDVIYEIITAENLTKCKTNSLEKAFEVSNKLRQLADINYPYASEFLDLAHKVEDFTIKLIEPLKGDAMKRTIFEGEDFDRISEKAIFFKQKKFISHPVVYKMSVKRWDGPFSEVKDKPWSSITGTSVWILMKIATVIDFFFFPLIFLLLYLMKLMTRLFKKECHVIFAMNPCNPWSEDEMKEVASSFNDLLRPQHTLNIVNKKEKLQATDPGCLFEHSFMSCLKTARKKFVDMEKDILKTTEKLLIVATDDNLNESYHAMIREIQLLKQLKVKIIFVGFGLHPDIKELEALSGSDRNVLLFQGNMQIGEITERLSRSFKDRSLFDLYFEYFNTPYIIYERDFFSYFMLLFLHLHNVFAPSSWPMDGVKSFIMLLFTGRIFMETHQAIKEKQICDNIISNPWSDIDNQMGLDEARFSGSSSDHDMMLTTRKPNIIRRAFRVASNMIAVYFSDWWNILDIIILVVFINAIILSYVGHFYWYNVLWYIYQGPSFQNNRLLAASGYLFGLNAMLLTLRIFGQIMESQRHTGSIQIALFQIIGAVTTIFGQFTAIILAFSFAIAKVYSVEKILRIDSFNATFYKTMPFFVYNTDSIKDGIDTWLTTVKHLIWSLLGMPEVINELETGDGPSDFLAQFLYGLFLLMAVLMLMNMMIALLSNTYQAVEDNAFYEWSYRRATTIRTYVKYHPIPVPFNIVSCVLLILWKLSQYILCIPCCVGVAKFLKNLSHGTEFRFNDFSTKTQHFSDCFSFFDCLVYDLQDEYFSKYGKNFPDEEMKGGQPDDPGEEANNDCTSRPLANIDENSELLAKLYEALEDLQSHSGRQASIIENLESKFDRLESKLDKHETEIETKLENLRRK